MPQLTGVAFKIAATFIFTFMSVLVKLASPDIPIGEIVFSRSFFGMFPILLVIFLRGEARTAFYTTRPWRHATRCVIGVSSMFLSFSALYYLPLPDATAIGYAMPMFGVAFAAIILKEVVRAYRWSAVAVGLAGVIVILYPHLSLAKGADAMTAHGQTIGACIALASAVTSAFAMVTVRSMARSEDVTTIVFYFAFGGAVIGLMTLPFGWVWPTQSQALMLASLGLIGGFAQILLTLSYKYADASVVAPFEYTSLLWSTLLGWWVFGDVPGSSMLLGSIIVIGAGLFVIYRERQLGLQRTPELQVGRTSR